MKSSNLTVKRYNNNINNNRDISYTHTQRERERERERLTIILKHTVICIHTKNLEDQRKDIAVDNRYSFY